jgi:methylenetetrahydrofolate reductase (NADPH)
MTIRDAYGPGRFGLSFELFPPKTAEGMDSLFRHVDELVKSRPSYITCTFGASGSTQDRTLEVIVGVREKYKLPVATHLTCVGLTAPEIRDYLGRAVAQGVENVVALRGDPPRGETQFKPVAGGFSYANELVQFIRGDFGQMGIAVAGYPETHQEAPSPQADLENLKRKVDAGADVVITQLFYNNEDFFRFRDRCREMGINVPIVPGILPVTNLAQIQRFTSMCGSKLPPSLVAALQQHADDPQGQFETGVEFAIEQTRGLLASDVPGLHFYVLNKSEATSRVLAALPRLTADETP